MKLFKLIVHQKTFSGKYLFVMDVNVLYWLALWYFICILKNNYLCANASINPSTKF